MLERHVETTTAEVPTVNEKYLSARKTRARYGDVSDMTLHRWRRHKNFPAPTYLSGRRYWRERELIRWEREQQALKAAEEAL